MNFDLTYFKIIVPCVSQQELVLQEVQLFLQ